MGIPVGIIGPSGSGKSASMRNLGKEAGVFNVASKPMPFRNKNGINVVNHADYKLIMQTLSKSKLRTFVIDDSQYLMAFSAFDNARVKGYEKFTLMAQDFYLLIRHVIEKTPDDCIVYFLHHTEHDENGRLKMKTLGKMLDNQLTVEGLFSIVLTTAVKEGKHYFITNDTDGTSCAKSPMDMFDLEIDNDLKAVDTAIREYYGFIKEENTNA